MTADRVKIGIVGIGNMGAVHVDHVLSLPHTELVAICDRNQHKLDAVEAGAEVAQFTRYQDMLESAALDGVIIATPHIEHPDMSIAAFERGLSRAGGEADRHSSAGSAAHDRRLASP